MECKLKKLLLFLACSVVMAGALSGCGSKDSGNREDQSIEEADKMEAGQNEVLTIASFNNLIKEDFISAFHEIYPEAELEVISYAGRNGSGFAMQTLMQGDIPDIYVTSQNFSEESQKKYLLDLSNYGFVNNYSTALLDSLDVDGSIYLLPSGYQLTGIYYNKTILEENGWDVPSSFQELADLSEKIEAAGYRTMGHGMSLDGFPFNYFFNIGNTVYFSTPEGKQWKEDFPKGEAKAVGNSELKKTAEYFQKWVDIGFITTEHMETERFYKGECVFFLCLGLNQYEYTTEDGKTYEFGTIPWLSEDGSSNMLTRTVSRYMGINKELAQKGNEKKLENALKLLEYISTVEGQKALMSSSSQYMLSLNETSLPEESPYQEIEGLVREGRTEPLVYVGWEKQIIPIAQDIKLLISGELDVDSLLEKLDQTNEELLNGSSDDIVANALETLSYEETARLVAIAEGKAAGADCAMISLNEYHGNDLCNNQGLGWRIYQGDINSDVITLFRPRSDTLSILEMTGAEIKAMRDGGFDLNSNGDPYEYCLFTKGDIELEDAVVYKLVISTGELTEDMRSKAQEAEVSTLDAVIGYLKELGEISRDKIVWE